MRRFQIHLSTAVALMLAAGLLIWANAVPARSSSRSPTWAPGDVYYSYRNFGWPFVAVAWTREVRESSESEVLFERADAVNKLRFAGDCAVGIGILAGVWFVGERLNRRRVA